MATRSRLGVVLAVALAGALVVLLVTRGDAERADAAPGPTATAERRDLVVPATAEGRLERSGDRTVVHLRGASSSTGGPPSTGAARSAAPSQGATSTERGATASQREPASSTTVPPATTSTTTPPKAGTGASPTTTMPRGRPPSTTTPTAPPSSRPQEPTTTTPTASPTTTAPATRRATTTTTTPRASAGPAAATTGQGTETLTWVLAAGSRVGQGTVLYRGDREPVVAIVGATPMWRALGIGSPNGDDVHQLEVALAALGHGDGLTVDDDFTAATAVAVQRWEQSLGRANPDGTVALGDVVAVSVDTSVSGLAARPGDRLRRGAPVLRLAEPTRRVVLDVVQGETGPWSPGTEVALEWDDGTSAIGRVDTVGRDAATGDDGRETVEVTVALAAEDTVHAIGTPARATVTAAIARAAVAVPVAAVAEGADGKPAVRVPAGERDDSVPVTLGFVADGWVAVTGIDEGTKVRLPG